MKQKKTMKLWQMITLLILSVVILVTMFLPAYHIDSDALKKGMENAQIEEDYYDNDEDRDKDIKKDTKWFEKKADKEKKENGTDNASISVLKLMTKSLSDIRYNGKYDEKHTKSKMGKETYDALNKKHNMTRIFLWSVYSLILVIILIIILGYGLKWNKYIPLAISTVYGVLVTAAFAVLRFAAISGVKKEVGELTKDFIGAKARFVNVDSAEIASGFIAYGFLLGLIAGGAFLIVSVISMFTGGQAEDDYMEGMDLDAGDDWDRDWNPTRTSVSQEARGAGYSGDMQGVDPFRGEQNPQPGVGLQDDRPNTIPSPSVTPAPSPAPEQSPAAAPVPLVRSGKVLCTKGMTAGSSGYSLAPDRKVIVGKSPHQANLVIINNTHISNVHCTIRYESDTDTYIVKDHSTNGTYANGTRMQKGVPIKYPSGTVLSLADKSVEIRLG